MAKRIARATVSGWSVRSQQRERRRIVGELIDGDRLEMRTRCRRTAVPCRRQNRLIGRDRKQAREIGGRHPARGTRCDKDPGVWATVMRASMTSTYPLGSGNEKLGSTFMRKRKCLRIGNLRYS